ncbi:MAG: low-specificity L-threonine aldolase [Syntrophomonadaceae bacterium]|nr:low-specificity L-threonine aldolase [Syntrophomonadaceae bacterium]
MAIIDLRSDTVTKPCDEMREAMRWADVGDDVYREDPSVNRLETLAAEMLGKEAGLFVASGTMGNLIAVLTHTKPGDEVLLEADSHIYYYEVGGIAAIAGVMPRLFSGQEGAVKPEQIADILRPPNIHFPVSSLLCMENTHNRAGGVVMDASSTQEVCIQAKKWGLKTHLDGARIFNAAVALKVPARMLAEPYDSVMFCLSKGLGAPVGSVLVGTNDWIGQARRWRKMLGGGMRQAGVLAACGVIALEKMVGRLQEDHRLARRLAEGLNKVRGISVNLEKVQTNIVKINVLDQWKNGPTLMQALKNEGILVNATGETTVRLVTHKDVNEAQIDHVINTVKGLSLVNLCHSQD